jgi:hypothetical protein
MEDFKMASSRVGPKGGIALAQGLAAGEHARPLPCPPGGGRGRGWKGERRGPSRGGVGPAEPAPTARMQPPTAPIRQPPTTNHPGQQLIRLDVSDNPMTSAIAPALASCVHLQRNLRWARICYIHCDIVYLLDASLATHVPLLA